MKTIDILINDQGQLTINATGYQGAECEKATAFLEQALGSLTQKQRKPEWYRTVQRHTKQRLGS
jgi:hypothetical protein